MGLIYPIFYDRLYSHFGPQGWWPAETKFEIIIGAILTQNTAWSNVVRALDNIKSAGGLTAEFLTEVPEKKLGQLIKPSGYFNQKARKLKAFISYLNNGYGGDLERFLSIDTEAMRKELLSIWGIGFETADDIILYAAGRTVFVIDAYTKRVLYRHLLCKSDVGYEELREIIEKEMPKNLQIYKEYHSLFVRLAKVYCLKKNPCCSGCPLNDFEKRFF